MTSWPLTIWLTCSTRTTCSPQVPCVTGVSDSAPNNGVACSTRGTCRQPVPWLTRVSDSSNISSAGVAPLSIWQRARGTTGPWQLIKKHDTVDLIYSRQSQCGYCNFSETCTYTLSWCLCLSFNPFVSKFIIPTEPLNARDKMAVPERYRFLSASSVT